LLLVAPALLASPCGVGPPPATFDLGTHDEPALFYLTDHLGSTILTVEDGGTLRNRYIYMPFGDPGIYNEGPSLRHRFLGEEILEGTGLYVLGARVYDPETGRFLQPDPLVANPSDPQSFNRYTYAP
jgi:RHS repeat-associated protein